MLVTYKMKAKEGSSYVATAAHFAEVSMGTNVNMCTTDDFTKPLDALVYYIDPDNEVRKIIMLYIHCMILYYDFCL